MRAGLPGLIRRATSETPVAGKEGHGREHRPLPNVDELCWNRHPARIRRDREAVGCRRHKSVRPKGPVPC